MKNDDLNARHMALVLAQKHIVDTWNSATESPTADAVVTAAKTFYGFMTSETMKEEAKDIFDKEPVVEESKESVK
jgi:hypothetical protein